MSVGRPTTATQLSPLHPPREPPFNLTLIRTQKATCQEFILYDLPLCSDSISCVRGLFRLISKYGHEVCPYFTRLKPNRSVVLLDIRVTPAFRGTASRQYRVSKQVPTGLSRCLISDSTHDCTSSLSLTDLCRYLDKVEYKWFNHVKGV